MGARFDTRTGQWDSWLHSFISIDMQTCVTTRYIQTQTLGPAKHEIEQRELKGGERETKRNTQRDVPSMSRPGPRPLLPSIASALNTSHYAL